MKLEINFEKRHLIILVLIGVLVSGSIVYAALNPTIPNPGHPISQLQKCSIGETLKINSAGEWACALGGSGSYIGSTNNAYTGSNVDHYTGGNQKCFAQYLGSSRMCNAADFANGRPSVNGWYNTYIGITDTIVMGDCGGWTGSAGWYGSYWDTYAPSIRECSNSAKILCCAD
jgi:hypothetical protein